MLNQKLKTIARLVEANDQVIDMGCDHAYLAIYLKKEGLCKNVFASDVSPKVVEFARNNIKKEHVKIPVYLSNGFDNIPPIGIDTVILSGMGSSTILRIIDGASFSIKKWIISSNNDQEMLRKTMRNKGFFVQKEVVVKENNQYYPILLFTKKYQRENKYTLRYGKSGNVEYFYYLLAKEKDILKNIPKKRVFVRIKHQQNIYCLNQFIKKNSK